MGESSNPHPSDDVEPQTLADAMKRGDQHGLSDVEPVEPKWSLEEAPGLLVPKEGG